MRALKYVTFCWTFRDLYTKRDCFSFHFDFVFKFEHSQPIYQYKLPLFLTYISLFLFGCRNDLPKLPYLTMCLKESMRINPPVLFIQRETTKPLVFDEWDVPAGTLINIPLYNVLNNHTVWENPLVKVYSFQPYFKGLRYVPVK